MIYFDSNLKVDFHGKIPSCYDVCDFLIINYDYNCYYCPHYIVLVE